MKKLSVFKIIQLSILAVVTLISVFFLLKPEVKQFVFSSSSATTLFFLIWIILIASFLFIIIDLSIISSIKLHFHNLYGVAYSDPLSGIPNRFSCDTLIEKYIDSELPEDIGCIMIELANLPEGNSLYDHAAGNRLLKYFSAILSSSALSLGFVGRNGGNKFLAIFEDCTQEKLDAFLTRVFEKVQRHNAKADSIDMEYKVGAALNSKEHLAKITGLIALANNRIYK